MLSSTQPDMARVIAALSQHLEPEQLEKTTRTLVHLYEEERDGTSRQSEPKPPRWADEEEETDEHDLPDLSTSFPQKPRRSAHSQSTTPPESVPRSSRPRVRFNDEPSSKRRRHYADAEEYASESSEDDNETLARSYIPPGSNKFRSFKRV